MKTTFTSMAAITFLFGLLSSTATLRAEDPKPIQIAEVKHEGPVDFEKEILDKILRRNCLACHNAADAESDLVLETPATILKGGSEGPAVVPGKSAESLLLKVAAHQKEPIMPPADNDVGAKPLTPEQLGLIKLWIDEGAKGEVVGAATKVVFEKLPPGVNPIYAAAISPDGQYVAAGRANQIFIYHAPSKRELGRLTDPELLKSGIYTNPGVAHLDLVQSLAFSPDNQTLASGGYKTVKLWQRARNEKVADLAGLDSPAKSIAVGPDGKFVAIGQENGKVKVFELASGKVVQTLEGHTAAASGVAFSADGTKLVTGSQDKTFRLWNVADWMLVGAAVETPAPVNAVALVAEDKLIATGNADNTIRTWALPGAPLAEGAEAAAPPMPVKELKGHGGPITALAVVPTNTAQLLSGSQDATARIWDVNTAAAIRTLNHGGPIVGVAVRPDGQKFATASSNNIAKLWNAADGAQVAELKGDFRATLDVGDMTRTVALAKRRIDDTKKDLEEAKKRKTDEETNKKNSDEAQKKAEEEFNKKVEAAKKPVADKEAADKAHEPNQTALAKAEEVKKAAEEAAKAADEALKKAQADLANAKDDAAKATAQKAVDEATAAKTAADEAKKKADADFTTAMNNFKATEAKVTAAAAPAQKAIDEQTAAERALSAAKRSAERAAESVKKADEAIPPVEALVKVCEDAHKKETESLEATKKLETEAIKPLQAIAFSANGSMLATSGDDQIVHTWDSETGSAIDTLIGQGAVITQLAFTASGNVIAVGQNNSIVVWNANPEFKLVRTIGTMDTDDLADRVTSLAFSPDGKLLATGSGEPSRSGQLKLWKTDDGTLAREIAEPHSDTIFAIEFSPDGESLATCGADRFVKVFKVADGEFVRSFEGHTHHVLGVSWRADGRVLASSGADNVIKLWDFRTGDQIRTITGINKELTSVRFIISDNGATINSFAVSCGDKNVYTKNDGGGNVRTFAGGTDFMYCVGVSGDGTLIVAGGQDSVLRIWNSANGQVVAAFAPPQSEQTASTEGGK